MRTEWHWPGSQLHPGSTTLHAASIARASESGYKKEGFADPLGALVVNCVPVAAAAGGRGHQ